MTPADIDPRWLTPKQWSYVRAYQELIDEGGPLTTVAICKRARISRMAAWKWQQDPKFLSALGKVLAAVVDPRDRLVDYAVQRRALSGVPSAVEHNLRRRGLWNTDRVDGPDGTGNPVLNAPGSVMFFGLPKPPTPQEAEGMRPPVGSNVIIPAPQLPSPK